jgi:hypothetical protein
MGFYGLYTGRMGHSHIYTLTVWGTNWSGERNEAQVPEESGSCVMGV